MKKYRIIAKENEIRIDKYITAQLKEYSRSLIAKEIERENILVNKKAVKASYKTSIGDIIDIKIPEENIELMAQDIALDILYEDEFLLIINKPYGMVVHPGEKNEMDTLVNALLYRYKKLCNMNSIRPGIVHRLDKNTSGLMICVKDDGAYEKLIEMFKRHEIKRKYYGLAEGEISHAKIIDKPLGRDPKNRMRMAVNYKNGKSAITFIEPIAFNKTASLLDIELKTGRMHQIRAHLKSIHRPIIGDDLYGFNNFKTDRMFLHSYSIEFEHPVLKKTLEYKTDIPKSFLEFMKKVDLIV
ncbi:MAG: RluA family pseudouridine synthase [Tissierellia bacterium]|nr:RluA family pseudouridine synthase [Tissierellia bacterium]